MAKSKLHIPLHGLGMVLVVLGIGVVFITIGYMKNKSQESEKSTKIEYRLVPKSIYDEQIENINVIKTYSDMFSDTDPIFLSN